MFIMLIMLCNVLYECCCVFLNGCIHVFKYVVSCMRKNMALLPLGLFYMHGECLISFLLSLHFDTSNTLYYPLSEPILPML
jgi:hypothetical protein